MLALKPKQSVKSSGTEGGRRPTIVPDEDNQNPDPEVVARKSRRHLTVSFKRKVVDMIANLRNEGYGAIGAYLRKEGLYYSLVRSWSTLRDQGQLVAKRSGPKKESQDSLRLENKVLRRRLEQTEKRLQKTEMIVELQKKISAMMDLDNPSDCEWSAER